MSSEYSTSINDLLGPDHSENNIQLQQQQPLQQSLQQQQQLLNTQNQHNELNNEFVDMIIESLNDTNISNTRSDADVHIPPPNLNTSENLLKSENTNSVIDLRQKMNEQFNNQNNKKFSFTDWIKNNLTEIVSILTFITLFFVMSLHYVNRKLFSFFPKLLLENGQISNYGLLFKTLISTSLYIIILVVIKYLY